MKAKIEELETNSTIKNIRDFYRSINDFKNGYQLRTNKVMYENGICLQINTVFWLCLGTISLSYGIFMGLPPINKTPRPYLGLFILYSTLGHLVDGDSCGGYNLMGVAKTQAG